MGRKESNQTNKQTNKQTDLLVLKLYEVTMDLLDLKSSSV